MHTFHLRYGEHVHAHRAMCAKAIAENQPWRASNMRGAAHMSGHSVYPGMLPYKYLPAVMQATYIIWSYETPIAWRLADGSWVMPDERYSASTTKQQSMVRCYLIG